MRIATVIVDDEKLAREELAFLLGEFPEIEVVGQAKNGIEGVRLVQKHQPQLLFLDAQMPGLDGFGTLRELESRQARLPFVVFATAFEQYALQAFEVNAVDYLLKPFDRARLSRTIDKVKRHLTGGQDVAGKIDRVLELLAPAKRTGGAGKVLARCGGRNLLLDQQEIVFARIEDGTITLATRQIEGQAAYRTIEELQADLDETMFWRAHRSFLINLNHVQEVVPWFNSSYQLRMNDRQQTTIPVSRSQSRRLREIFKL